MLSIWRSLEVQEHLYTEGMWPVTKIGLNNRKKGVCLLSWEQEQEQSYFLGGVVEVVVRQETGLGHV